MDDLITLPGSIPGLLRRGSPVWTGWNDGAVVVRVWPDGTAAVMADHGESWLRVLLSELALDLTDATGRAHAAWWLLDRPDPRHRSLLVEPRHADPGYLRQTCLHVAGVPA